VLGSTVIQTNGSWRFGVSGLGDGRKDVVARSIDLALALAIAIVLLDCVTLTSG
jgi:hypothetical protein